MSLKTNRGAVAARGNGQRWRRKTVRKVHKPELVRMRARPAREPLQVDIPFWRNLDLISQYQRAIIDNWGLPHRDWFTHWFQMVPTYLWQSILPWNFSLIQFTSQMRGDPTVESRILTQVAGYGSQLGTMMDLLQLMTRRMHLTVTALHNEADLCTLVKFNDLTRKIDRAKGTVELEVSGAGEG